jgi:hypothetical protein
MLLPMRTFTRSDAQHPSCDLVPAVSFLQSPSNLKIGWTT